MSQPTSIEVEKPMMSPTVADGVVSNSADLFTLAPSVQGYIVEGHGCDHQTHLFITFKDNASPGDLRRAIATLAQRVTPADRLLEDKARPREERHPTLDVWAIGVSSQGYRKMGFPNRFPPDFQAGFAGRSLQAALSDSNQW